MLVHGTSTEPWKFSRFEDTYLGEEAMKAVRQDVNETPETRSKGLTILRNMLTENKDLRPCTDDDFLLRFLRVAKFDCSKAYDRILRYYGLRKKFPHLFRKYLPSKTRMAKQLKLFHVSPYRAKNHSAVVINYHGMFDPSILPMEEKFALDMMAAERGLDNPLTQMCGANVILDFKGFTFFKMLALTPQVVRMYVEFLQNSFPVRLKSIIFLNAPTIFTLIFNLFYPVLSKKLKSRLLVHSTNESWDKLHAVIPPEILPEEYGGLLKNSQLKDLCEGIEDQEERFAQQAKYGFLKVLQREEKNLEC
ncbi:alpha-tocopherol transfer protein-like [Uloborus diversus]|uniref:alpha-tocopherol transfer protein-like n=1 Tax=Uloborus diversus TaxID=327109 RepID=UPI00240A82DA|nr:alpha-tocopherol transfer protein-like [Uloborus diversus]